MNRLRYFIAAVVLIAGVGTLSSHGQEEKARDLMKKKLQHSQKVLEGIALNDFDMITKNADELVVISKAADWTVLKTPEYEMYSNDFRRSAADLSRKANAKNIDGAALAYVEMTLTCVKCHKHVREVRRTGLDPLDERGRATRYGE